MLVVVRDLLVGSTVLVWLGGATRTAADARRRFCQRSPQVFWAAVAVLVPIAGVGLYMLVRPAQTRAERRARRYTLLLHETLAGPDERLLQRSTVETADDGEQRVRVLVPSRRLRPQPKFALELEAANG
jgi:membrane protein implicated in regulation of membrane protease activity